MTMILPKSSVLSSSSWPPMGSWEMGLIVVVRGVIGGFNDLGILYYCLQTVIFVLFLYVLYVGGIRLSIRKLTLICKICYMSCLKLKNLIPFSWLLYMSSSL